ncbi:hypothetical protein TNCV_4803001 [Trichonephila clavipes]|nr:hypothetical protein TNCV_4803001 [Trichonephila clavipes]
MVFHSKHIPPHRSLAFPRPMYPELENFSSLLLKMQKVKGVLEWKTTMWKLKELRNTSPTILSSVSPGITSRLTGAGSLLHPSHLQQSVGQRERKSHEAHFWLNGYVNKQNCRIWSEANPQVYVETLLHPEKLTVWCSLWAGGPLLQKR